MLTLVSAVLMFVGVSTTWLTIVTDPPAPGRISVPEFGTYPGLSGFDYLLLGLAVFVVLFVSGVFERTRFRVPDTYGIVVGALAVCAVLARFLLVAGTDGAELIWTTGPGFVVSLWGGTLLVAGSALRASRIGSSVRAARNAAAVLTLFAIAGALATFSFQWAPVEPSSVGVDVPPQPAADLVSTVFVSVIASGAFLCGVFHARGRHRRAGKALFFGGVSAAVTVVWRTNTPREFDLGTSLLYMLLGLVPGIGDNGIWSSRHHHVGPSVYIGVFAAFLLLVAGTLLWDASRESNARRSSASAGTAATLTAAFGAALFVASTAMAWSVQIVGSDLYGAKLTGFSGPLSAELLTIIVVLGVVLLSLLAFADGRRRYAGIGLLALGVATSGFTVRAWQTAAANGVFSGDFPQVVGPAVPVAVCGAALLITSGALLYAVGSNATAEKNAEQPG